VLWIVKIPVAEFKGILDRDLPFIRGVPVEVLSILLEGVPIGFFSSLVSDKLNGEF